MGNTRKKKGDKLRKVVPIIFGYSGKNYLSDGLYSYEDVNLVVSGKSVKRYMGSLSYLSGLSEGVRTLLDYYTEVMDRNNVVRTGIYDIQEYIEIIRKLSRGVVVYELGGVKWCLGELRRSGLLLPYCVGGEIVRGYGVVNPIFYYGGVSERERIKLIKTLYSGMFVGSSIEKFTREYLGKLS
jgi:hypothetical protein